MFVWASCWGAGELFSTDFGDFSLPSGDVLLLTGASDDFSLAGFLVDEVATSFGGFLSFLSVVFFAELADVPGLGDGGFCSFLATVLR